jgi:hypothetical protein
MIAWKYINKTAATIATIRDYDDMAAIIENTPDEIKLLRENMTSPRSPNMSGMPSTHNPQSGEEKLVAQIDRLNLMEERYRTAREYMDWFKPAWSELAEREQRILRECYMADSLRNGARFRLAEELHYSERHIDNLRDKALRRIQTLLFG